MLLGNMAAALPAPCMRAPPPSCVASCQCAPPQAEVQTVRADGQVQLHVRDAVASKLPPGMLVTIPATLVRPQRKHVYHWPAAGEQGGSLCLS